MNMKFLNRPFGSALAYRHQEGLKNLPVLVFMPGFRSDMEGTKAVFLSEFCGRHAIPFLRFDYSGHGRSEGDFADGTIGTWKDDALAMLDMLGAETSVIIVGSSMGGWIGLLCALERKPRVKGFIGLAAAPDFTRYLEGGMTAQQKETFRKDGRLAVEDGTGAYEWTRAFLKEGESHCLLNAPVPLECPVRLVHGLLDDDVPVRIVHEIAGAITGNDVQVYIRLESGHRLSSPDDLNLLGEIVSELYSLRNAA